MRNLANFGVDTGKIRHIVISHEHWDHTGGLWRFLEDNRNVTVHVCSEFSGGFKEKANRYGVRLNEISTPVKIRENIFSTGRLSGPHRDETVYEQSLLLKPRGSRCIVTGCSHPGILNILDHIEAYDGGGGFDLVIGGMHLMNHDEAGIEEIASAVDERYKVKYMVPLHCTGKSAVRGFRKKMPGRVWKMKTGTSLRFNNETASWEPG